jgi:hypothetical protein
VEIATLDDVLFSARRNDVAFIVNDKIVVLIEHQSTVSENMPLRLLLYIARIYEKLVENDAVYKKKLLPIPKPDFIVLYNGADLYPDKKTLRLSDAYKERVSGVGGALELEALVININEGCNEDIVSKCGDLSGYARFVGKVRANQGAGLSIDAAVTKAAEDCIKEGVLEEFLKLHTSEVLNMLTAEWDITRARKVWEQEAWEDGIEKGIEKGRIAVAQKLLRRKRPIEEIIEETGLTLEEIESLQMSV